MRADFDRGPSPSETEIRSERAQRDPIAQPEIDAALAGMLRRIAYPPDELFYAFVAKGDRQRQAARDLAQAKLRAVLADALENDTPANAEAVGRCAMVLLHLAMDDTVREHVERNQR